MKCQNRKVVVDSKAKNVTMLCVDDIEVND